MGHRTEKYVLNSTLLWTIQSHIQAFLIVFLADSVFFDPAGDRLAANV
jgi:hypothetical protein